MSNKYTEDGRFIVDANGKQWAVETWHPAPLPNGVEAAPGLRDPILCGFESDHVNCLAAYNDARATHWLARAPLPPVPKPKSQEELDCEALYEYRTANRTWTTDSLWFAALKYARKDTK